MAFFHRYHRSTSFNGMCCLESLAEGLSHGASSLTTLELRWQMLDDIDMPLFCAGLRDSRSMLTRLDLGRNPINDQGISSFVQCYVNSNHCQLQDLILDHITIGPDGTHLLMRALTNLPSFKYLDLSWNAGIEYNGLRLIGDELPRLRLHRLKLTGCTDTDLRCSTHPIQIDARRKAGCALLQGIQECVHIRSLDVQQNGLEENSVHDIEFYCNLNRHGRFLLVEHDDGLVPALWCRVLAKCDARADFIYFFLREQPNLVQTCSHGDLGCL